MNTREAFALLSMNSNDFPPFRPHPLLRGGHAQTIAGVYLPSGRERYAAAQHRLQLEDGDQIVVHDDCPTDWKPGGRAVLLIHGLGGCHGSPYMVRITRKLIARGVRVFRMDLRGWGAGAKLAQQPFHAARIDDISTVIERVQEIAGQSCLCVAGFSLGGNMLLKLLGTRSIDGVDRAIAVGPPIDLMYCCSNLERGMGRLYDRNYARFLWNHVRERAKDVPICGQAIQQRPPRQIVEFDERFTAPWGGFDSVEHYYDTASAKGSLSGIRIRTTILTADDDPVVPGEIFDKVETSGSVTIHRTTHGGHLGYIGRRNGDPDRRWMDWRVVEWVCATKPAH